MYWSVKSVAVALPIIVLLGVFSSAFRRSCQALRVFGATGPMENRNESLPVCFPEPPLGLGIYEPDQILLGSKQLATQSERFAGHLEAHFSTCHPRTLVFRPFMQGLGAAVSSLIKVGMYAVAHSLNLEVRGVGSEQQKYAFPVVASEPCTSSRVVIDIGQWDMQNKQHIGYWIHKNYSTDPNNVGYPLQFRALNQTRFWIVSHFIRTLTDLQWPLWGLPPPGQLPPAFAPQIGVHVRHGDACTGVGYSTWRKCFTFQAFADSTTLLVERYGFRSVYLSTDNATLLRELAQQSLGTYETGLGPGGVPWVFDMAPPFRPDYIGLGMNLEQVNKKALFDAGARVVEHRAAVQDYWNLLRSHGLVGQFSNNWERLVMPYIFARSGGCGIPFASLDGQPWCFDYARWVVSKFTFKC